MTTNQDRAAEVILPWIEREHGNPDDNADHAAKCLADAGLLAALPDTIVDGEELREITRNVEASTPGFPTEYQGKLRTWARRLNALLPDPAPRTLADMTPEEREACQWMQAELDGDPEMRVVISSILPAGAHVLFKDGWISFRPGSAITPLPDLPRMVWPDEQATEEDMSIIPPEIDTSTGHDDHVDMTPEAVAEVIRLRRELEELRDEYAAPPKHDLSGDKFVQGMESSYQVAAHVLTRILEGTHE